MKLVFVFIFLMTSIHLALASDIDVTSVVINCSVKNKCKHQKYTFKSLRRKFSSIEHLNNILKLYVANEGVKNLDYLIYKEKNKFKIEINIEPKPQIIDFLGVNFVDRKIDIPAILPVKEDDYLDINKVNQTLKILKELAKDRGFPNAIASYEVKEVSGGVSLNFIMNLKDPLLIKSINISSESKYLQGVLENTIGEFRNQPFDLSTLKSSLENIRKLFLQYGYYLAEVDLKNRRTGKNEIILFLNIKNASSYTFYLKGLDKLKEEKLKRKLSQSLISYKREMSSENVQQVVDEFLLSFGIVNSSIKVQSKSLLTYTGEKNTIYDVDIEEGFKGLIGNVDFRGNSFFSNNELKKLFFADASELASAGLHDTQYYNNFVSIMNKHFVSKGFLSVFIENPVVELNKNTNRFDITYKIREGIRTQIRDIKISGVSTELKKEIGSIMTNKESGYFNPIAFQDDLDNIKRNLKSKGYYFGEIKNLNQPDIVVYRQDNSVVDINLEIDTGHKLYTNEIIIIGNIKTRKILILRELALEKGELITSEKIQTSQANLLSLGIFDSVQISPVGDSKSKTDVLVFVREKDFGFFEIAPGVRTDLGLKVSARFNYNNIDGMNKRITSKLSINKRTDLSVLDEVRRKESSSLLEFDATIDYAENHIFHSPLDFTSTLSKSRRRFYAFDADIQRLGVGLSYDVTKWLNASASYQLETISQFDASEEENHGHFQIGSVTPALTFDFRNRSVNTTKGAYFNLSCEFANPSLLSQENDELTINYYKLINRNKFYYPLSRDVIIAVSTSFGIQENLANKKKSDGQTEGKIPPIKVFRLSGADIVRGYEDGEINRLISNEDISSVEVNSRAYMANIKFEPRLFLSDSTMLGVFYDAGRIFVDEFQGDELRSSAGISFKYLTPVGSLDFDYGIKLLRKRDADGTLDSPGRLHVSIGFF